MRVPQKWTLILTTTHMKALEAPILGEIPKIGVSYFEVLIVL